MSPITIIKALDSAQQGAEIYSMRGGIEITKSRYNQEKKNLPLMASYSLGQVLGQENQHVDFAGFQTCTLTCYHIP